MIATREIPGSIPGMTDARMIVDLRPGGSVERDAHEGAVNRLPRGTSPETVGRQHDHADCDDHAHVGVVVCTHPVAHFLVERKEHAPAALRARRWGGARGGEPL